MFWDSLEGELRRADSDIDRRVPVTAISVPQVSNALELSGR